MGIFSSIWETITGAEQEYLNVPDAFVDVISATILYDKDVDQEELDYAYSFIEGALDVDPSQARDLIDTSLDRVKRRGLSETIEMVAEVLISDEHRRMGYMAALGVSKAESGWFSDGEEKLLKQLQQALALSDDDVRGINEELEAINSGEYDEEYADEGYDEGYDEEYEEY